MRLLMNVFDLENQNTHLESKIVAALERISEAFRTLLWEESKQFGLSPIQIQILIFCLTHSEEKRKVGYMALEFNLTKATISDSVKVLEQKNLLGKMDDAKDSRSYSLFLTKEGKEIAEKTVTFTQSLVNSLQNIPPNKKESLFVGLQEMIFSLHQTGVISIQRMCLTCSHHEMIKKNHYCNLLNKTLMPDELRIDCPEHQQKN
jgi:DNA-binding MarR family transcriptional regulator